MEKKSAMSCILCNHSALLFAEISRKTFYACQNCGGMMRAKNQWLTSRKEEQRYGKHENDVEDLGYQQFVKPIVKAVQKDFTPATNGLDYGCGPGPVAAKLLTDAGFSITLYDPFFYDQPAVLNEKYDFILCCEVMEHFYNPMEEFRRLFKLLKPNGKLYCKTGLLTAENRKNFAQWWYKNDPAHVFFYSEKTLQYIQQKFDFKKVTVSEELIVFDK